MDIFKNKAFDVEHALSMYAKGYAVLPASYIYDDKVISQIFGDVSQFHIYIIGLIPKINITGCRQEYQNLIIETEIVGKKYDLRWSLPEGAVLKCDQNRWCVECNSGDRIFPDAEEIMRRLSSDSNEVNFEVLYIGQAFGENGSRNALDRLKRHETLQKIAVKGIPENYNLTILMISVETDNRIITMFNPFAKNTNDGSARIKNGIDKLFDTNEAERTTLYEASLIRYFQPKFNKEFKKSFPSTNMKILKDCYDKDFSTLIAEICIDELPFTMFSGTVDRSLYHIAKHDLHTDEDRRVFFG